MSIDKLLSWISYPFLYCSDAWRGLKLWLAREFEEDAAGGIKKNSIAVLDGVRGIAVLLVIIFHVDYSTIKGVLADKSNQLANSVLNAGASGVTLFFVLSGFLLFMPYAKALLSEKRWPLARVFYLRRALRILPGYYISLFILMLIANRQYLHFNHLQDDIQFFTLFMDSSLRTWRQINGPYWTLAIEWQFYLLLPLLVLLFAAIVKRFPLKYRMPVTIICLVGTVAWALIVRHWGFFYLWHASKTFLVPRHLLNWVLFFTYGVAGKYTEDFALGMLASLCYIYAQQAGPESKFKSRAQRLSLWLWGFGILVLVFGAMWRYNHDYHGWPFLNNPSLYNDFSEVVSSIGYASCVFAILTGPDELRRPFEWVWLRWVGLISYSLYIWHLPLMVLFEREIAPHFPGLLANTPGLFLCVWLWVLLVVFPFCLFTYHFVEKPWIKLSDRWRKEIEERYRARVQVNVVIVEKQGELAGSSLEKKEIVRS